MLLHANHASQNGYKTTMIASEDTYVTVLCSGHCKKISSTMYLKCGTQNRTRYINMSNLAELHGDDLCDAFVGVHAFTGCDSASALTGREKLSALKLLEGSSTFQEHFKSLGTSLIYQKNWNCLSAGCMHNHLMYVMSMTFDICCSAPKAVKCSPAHFPLSGTAYRCTYTEKITRQQSGGSAWKDNQTYQNQAGMGGKQMTKVCS